jgi:diguanylate cyclase (GGDEF)-like protein/PAS domain S-box-containing protein
MGGLDVWATPVAIHEPNARPTARDAGPFILVAALGLGSTMAPPYHEAGPRFWLLLGLCGVILGFVWAGLRPRSPSWIALVPAYLFFVVLGLARDLTGGSASGLGPLVALPILWLALTGSRRELLVVSVLTPLLFLLPIVVVGPPLYIAEDWRRALGWTAFALFVAPVVQRIVHQLARETRRARAAGAEMDGIMRGAHLTSIISTDLDGTIRSFSVGAEELLGFRSDEVIGRHGPELFHDPVELVAAAEELGVEPGFPVIAALARAAAPTRIWTYVRADGSRAFVRLALTELHDDNGRITGYLGVGIDSTAAVEAQRALSQSEALRRVLMDHLPDTTLVMVDGKLKIKVVAGAGAVAQGLRGTEGYLIPEVSNPANTTVLKDLLERALAGQEATGEIMATATGEVHEVVATPLPDDGVEQRALLLARNVDAERARERDLVRAKQRAERLFVDAPHGVAVLALDGTVLTANDAMLCLAGVTEPELVGRPLGALGLPGSGDLGPHLQQVLSHPGAPVETDWTLRNAHGQDLHVVLSSRALTGEDDADDADDVVLVNVVDVSERYRYEQRLAHLADHDVLTGLANRRRFERELDDHLQRCRRYGPSGALLLLDLDHFKDVNDTLGHGAGDQLIVSTAQLLRGGVRDSDIVARLGGDEFAILLAEGDRAAAETVAASIVTRVREHTATLDGTYRRVTASVGAVTLRAASGHAADVLALADMTMYDAKDAGRNQYVVLDEDSARPPRSGARLQWKSRIERALDTDGFELHLQPIQDLRTNRIHSAEALIRMRDGDTLIPPSRFLYIAERAGLVPDVDSWVVKNGVEMLADLRVLDPDFRLEVNLSGHSIGHPDTERVIVESLRKHDVDPAALILEITETAAVADVGLARAFAERMTALGCKFALDDFGAGFGSFYYLKHLLFDYVKIDGEFVSNCHHSEVDRTIMRSIVGIARDLGKQTVAEFVSHPAILEIVRDEGVDLAQGFLIGEPVPYDDFVTRFLPAGDPVDPADPADPSDLAGTTNGLR